MTASANIQIEISILSNNIVLVDSVMLITLFET
jgi:hypothetical protein